MGRAHREQNRRAWNEVTPIHLSYRKDDIRFFRSGGSTLPALDLDALGDLRGRRVLHLQCNSGQDTLSLARCGAVVTGVDISDEAIESARALSTATRIAAEFVRADVMDWSNGEREAFDIVYATRGVICWIDDLRSWMQTVRNALRVGGFLYLMDSHPLSEAIDPGFEVTGAYFEAEQPERRQGLDYIRGEFIGTQPNHQFRWSLGAIVTAATTAGLTLRWLQEHPFDFFRRFERFHEREGWFVPPDAAPRVPLSFSLRADR